MGSCHCGAVQFIIKSEFKELTTCDCSICIRKNALMVMVHQDKLEILQGNDVLTRYRFHTHTAHHYFCSVCGIYPFHRKRMAPDHYGVNVHCLEEIDLEGIPIRHTDGKGMN